MKKMFGIVLGALLVACGVLYLLSTLGIADISVSLDGWWTLFIILPCLNGLVTDQDKIGSLIGLSVGVLLLLAARGIFEYNMVWKVIVPIILVLLGIKLMVRSVSPSRKASAKAVDGQIEAVAAFREENTDFGEESVSCARVGAVFGAATCNLTNADIQEGCRLEVNCLFGGAEIYLPKNVVIRNNTFSLFGGIEDERKELATDGEKVTLLLEGYCAFGGVSIQ